MDMEPARERKVFSISELAARIKSLLESDVGSVWVEGEISGFKQVASGHMYFDLKDDKAVLNCALFRGSQRGVKVKLANGLQVRAHGDITSYPPRSNYQMIVRAIEPVGKGSLQEQFEKLKERLAKEGLFDPARKKPIPLLPQRLGIVTSPTGAAIRDILKVLARRYPNLHITIAPVRVQGEGAAEEIAGAIDLFNRLANTDVLIVGRGGGSLEDLWAFNEEAVARAIARSAIPVISAVGHETDFTIADFVADLRAPTPSAAAEMVVGQKDAFEERLRVLNRHLAQALRTRLLEIRNRVAVAAGSYVFREPGNLLKSHRQRIDLLRRSLAADLRAAHAEKQTLTDELALRLTHRMDLAAREKRQIVARIAAQLRALSPLAVLDRGYSITRDAEGRAVRDAASVTTGMELETLLAKGTVTSRVTGVDPSRNKRT